MRHSHIQVTSSLIICFLIGISWQTVCADDQAFFENEVRPLLVRECLSCHGAKKQEASLRLDHIDGFLKGGDSGAAIVPRAPEQSLFIAAIRHEGDVQMPPEKKLSNLDIQTLEKWVTIGAPWFGDKPTNLLRSGPPTPQEREHWAYQPLNSAEPPIIENDDWSQNEIDRFILEKWAPLGIRPAERASDETLLRRLYLDLTGIPPSPETLYSIKEMGLAPMYNDLVKELLASQQYGEQWGRHWLDVVRYADTAGETADFPVREAYKYRNYVINSFRRNKPYDQFVAEQIAGDLLAHNKTGDAYTDSVTGTGFIAISRRYGFDPENYDHLMIQDTMDTLGQAFLGLTIGCARCHDHKYDPISLQDYYALYGIFESTTYAYPGSEGTKTPSAFPSAISPSELEQQLKQHAAELAVLEASLADAQRRQKELEAAGAKLFSLDAGFELQKVDSPLGKPWTAHDQVIVRSKAQSPYKNVIAGGNAGISIPGGSVNAHFSRKFEPAYTTETINHLFTNIDFRILDGPNGDFRFYWGEGPGTSSAAMVSIGADGISVWDDDKYTPVGDLEVGKWYNLQVQLNLGPRTYDVTISTADTSQHFRNIKMHRNWSGVVDTFFEDRYGYRGADTPPREIDNVIISEKPLATLGESHDSPFTALQRLNPYAHNLFNSPLAETGYDVDGHTGFFVNRLNRHKECSIGVNRSDKELMIPGVVPPGKLVIHPSSTNGIAIAWTAPEGGEYSVRLDIADAHICGDSIHWHLSRYSSDGMTAIADKSVEANGTANYATAENDAIELKKGDILLLTFDPKVNYGCDLTQVEFQVSNSKGIGWVVSKDFLLAANQRTFSNPLPATNGGYWWFFEPTEQLCKDWSPVRPADTNSMAEHGRELASLNKVINSLTSEIETFKENPEGPKVYGVSEGSFADAQIRIRGERKRLGDVVVRRNLEILGGDELKNPATSSGRLDLANWIVNDNRHMLARVMVNRIWQYHFGRGLVTTPNDFGTRGSLPSHPELLDYLSQRFIDSGFDINRIHRLILESATYQQSSVNPHVEDAIDPSNALLWKYNSRRISAENIRDSWMVTAGTLNSDMGGEHPFPPPTEWTFSQHAPFYGMYDTDKRSIYLMTQRIRKHPFLALFDGADTNASTPFRVETTVPTQSLYLLNSEFVHAQAMALAKRIVTHSQDQSSRLQQLYAITLTRAPSQEEQQADATFLAAYNRELIEQAVASDEALISQWAALARTIITSNEFLTIE